jgi:hypothetical protein
MPFPYTLPVTLGDPVELTPGDVERYTGGRLSADDPETARMLNAALAAARNDVDWHVSPVKTGQVLVKNGPGGYKLRLPTQKIVKLTSIVDNGVSLNVDQTTAWPPGPDVVIDAEVGWLLHRRRGCWSHRPGGITITFDHGYTADQAADWRQAILSMVDQMVTLVSAGRPDADLASKQVDDVTYKWGAAQALPGAEPILQKYRLCWGVA